MANDALLSCIYMATVRSLLMEFERFKLSFPVIVANEHKQAEYVCALLLESQLAGHVSVAIASLGLIASESALAIS